MVNAAALALAASLAAAAAPAAPDAASVDVDPRVELLSAVQALTPASAASESGTPYERELRSRFAAQAKHPAVAAFSAWTSAGVPDARVLELLLRASPPPELKLEDGVPEPLLKDLGGAGAANAFLAKLRVFAAASGFASFYDGHRAFYAQVLKAARKELDDGVDPKAMSAYLGRPFPQRYRVLLAPAFRGGGMLMALRWGPTEVVEARFRNERGSFGLGDFGASLAHEMASTVTRPLAHEWAERLEGRAPPKGCSNGGAGAWEGCVNEHVLRAIEHRLVLRKTGRPPEFLNVEDFPYHPALVAALKDYEADRARYPTLDSFGPRLVAVFRRPPPKR